MKATMPTKIFNQVVQDFLCSDTPAILSIKGGWGVGKTFAWNTALFANKETLPLESYSYVSLFGIKSIKDLQIAIFSKLISTELLSNSENNINSLNHLIGSSKHFIKRLQEKYGKFLDLVPYGKNITLGFEAFAPHFISNALICLDDFERSSIDPDELLGFISSLKEEKSCKVCLIFNEEKLENKKNVYEKYREKVIDVEIVYAPSPEEAARIGISSMLPDHHELISNAVSLEITNIRILKKISDLSEKISKELGGFDPEILKKAYKIIVVSAWCYFDPSPAKPTIEYLMKWNQLYWMVSTGDKNKEQKTTEDIGAEFLSNYGLMHIDEFDNLVIQIVKQGFVEGINLRSEAEQLDNFIKIDLLRDQYNQAWQLFNDSFDSNQDLFVEKLLHTFNQAISYLPPSELDRSVGLLRQLGLNDSADSLISSYLEVRGSNQQLLDLDSNSSGVIINDQMLAKEFATRLALLKKYPTLIEVRDHLLENSGWSSDQLKTLRTASVSNYVDLFKNPGAVGARKTIQVLLKVGKILGYEDINAKLISALKIIGEESLINEIRVRQYGIH